MKLVSTRLLIPLAVFVGTLALIAAFSGVFGGWVGFAWVVKHGASGPLVAVTLHYGSAQAGSVLLAVALLAGLATCALGASRWALAVSVVSVLAWIFVGLGAGV